MRLEQFQCDVCGAVKKDANHWWQGAIDRVGNGNVFIIAPWNAVGWVEDERTPVFHICGQECATQKLNEFMNAQPLADPPAVKKDAAGDRGGSAGVIAPEKPHPFEFDENPYYCEQCAGGPSDPIHQRGAQPLEPEPAESTQTERVDEAPIPIETEREQS